MAVARRGREALRVTPRSPNLTAIRRAAGKSVDGTIRLLFVRAGGRVGLVQTPLEAADNADQFLAGYIAGMITDVAAPSVLVTVSRADGRPTHADRQLWSMLAERLAPTSTALLDLVVIGSSRAWSARRNRPINPPRKRRAVRATKKSAVRATKKSAVRATKKSANRQSAARRSASQATAR
jgi:hypothetical protein